MSRKISFFRIALDAGRLGFLVPLFALLHCGNASAACNPQDIDIQCGGQVSVNYDNPGGTPITDPVALCPAPPATTTQVDWAFTQGAQSPPACTSTSTTETCTDGTNMMVLTVP